MTASVLPPPATPVTHGNASGVAVALGLARRSLLLIKRVPAALVPTIFFPLIIVVAFSGAYGGLTRLPGFPVSNMIDWMLPMAVIQGAAFAGVNVGIIMIRDFEDGFFDRLLIAPVSRLALIAGPMLGALGRGLIPTVSVLLVGLIAGASMPGGVVGVLTLTIASLGAAAMASAWAIGLALRIKHMKAAPLMQIGLFVGVFLSTAQVPIEVMTGWLKGVARFNPTTYILALGRQGFVGPITWADTWPGLLAIAGSCVVLGAFALRGLRKVVP
ncbi:MAG: ABC transporter permease [Acidimicrobiales bacterium]